MRIRVFQQFRSEEAGEFPKPRLRIEEGSAALEVQAGDGREIERSSSETNPPMLRTIRLGVLSFTRRTGFWSGRLVFTIGALASLAVEAFLFFAIPRGFRRLVVIDF